MTAAARMRGFTAAVRALFGCSALTAVLGGAANGCKTREDVTPRSLAAAEAGPSPSASRVQIEEAPASGTVESLVRDALARALTSKRRLVVYVGASWCEPCTRFHQAALHGDLDAAFPDVNLLSFDLDRDRDRLVAAGYVSKLIPLFALPEASGHASGKQVEGGIKGDGAVAYMMPRLQGLLQM